MGFLDHQSLMTQEVGTQHMKVQLVVVQGKPEGKSIPLVGPSFKIGRGDGCHLRPNSDLVSREHAEFQVADETVVVLDLGSRNGTEVNGKKLAANTPATLKNGDLVKIGTLTFAVAIEGVPLAKAAPAAAPRKPSSLDDVSGDDIDAWLVSDGSRPTPERPSGVYGGDTMTIETFNGKGKSSGQIPVPPKAAEKPAPAPAPAPVPVPVPVAEATPEPDEEIEQAAEEPEEPEEDDGIQDLAAMQEAEAAADEAEEFVDESNPFYVAKKAQSAQSESAPAAKAPSKDSSDAAGDILRKMMDRRRASKS